MKPDLILLHGALGSKRYFQDVKAILKEHFEIHLLNFEGHGGEETNKEFSIALFAENLIEYLDENELKKVLVFGYSMGGYVALTVAHQRPELIDRIITLGTKFNWSPEMAAQEVKMLNPDIIEQKVPQFAAQLNTLHQPANWKVVMHKTADLMLGLGAGKGLKDEALTNIQTPVTIGIGDKDRMVTMEESERAAKILPNGELCLLENVPHPIEKIDLTLLTAYILRLANL